MIVPAFASRIAAVNGVGGRLPVTVSRGTSSYEMFTALLADYSHNSLGHLSFPNLKKMVLYCGWCFFPHTP